MRPANRHLVFLTLLSAFALAGCGEGSGDGSNNKADQPANEWNSMKWDEGEWQ